MFKEMKNAVCDCDVGPHHEAPNYDAMMSTILDDAHKDDFTFAPALGTSFDEKVKANSLVTYIEGQQKAPALLVGSFSR